MLNIVALGRLYLLLGYDEAVSYSEICRAIKECRRGVSFKEGPTTWYTHRLMKADLLQRDILKNRYHMRPGTVVEIYKPKRRTAVAPWFRDRVWQRSMCNNGVYDDLTKSCIRDNMACQKGKGNDLMIRSIVKSLQELYRRNNGAPIYGVHLDIKKYFPSTPHEAIKELDRRRIQDKRFIPYLTEIIDSMQDPRPESEVALDPFGARGTGLGSQVNQLHQIALLNDLDHTLSIFCRTYKRYNDDFLVLDCDRKVVERARDVIDETLRLLGLKMTDKSGIFVVQKTGFSFLRKRFILKPSGKIIIRLHKKALADERKVLRNFKKRLDRGITDWDAVQRHYQSWVASAEYAGDAPIHAMDNYCKQLFNRVPNYKRKKRYLYGTDCNKRRKT